MSKDQPDDVFVVVVALEDPGHAELQVGAAAENLGQEAALLRWRRVLGPFFGLDSFLDKKTRLQRLLCHKLGPMLQNSKEYKF